MTDPVMFTRGFSIALVSLLQAIMPPIVVVGTLVLLCHVYGTEFTDFFEVLAVSVAVLSSLLPRGRTNGRGRCSARIKIVHYRNVLFGIEWRGRADGGRCRDTSPAVCELARAASLA